MEFMNVAETADKWGLKKRRVQKMCSDGRIEGAIMLGGKWKIPLDAKKPDDLRVKSGKYINMSKKRQEIIKSILIAEDNDINREILKELFKGEYPTIEAVDGQEAIDILEERSDEIGLLLLDLVMPKKSGIEVLERMKELSLMDYIPVIMITGEATPESDRQAYELGVSDIIYKPFSSPIVKQRSRNYIEYYKLKKVFRTSVD